MKMKKLLESDTRNTDLDKKFKPLEPNTSKMEPGKWRKRKKLESDTSLVCLFHYFFIHVAISMYLHQGASMAEWYSNFAKLGCAMEHKTYQYRRERK